MRLALGWCGCPFYRWAHMGSVVTPSGHYYIPHHPPPNTQTLALAWGLWSFGAGASPAQHCQDLPGAKRTEATGAEMLAQMQVVVSARGLVSGQGPGEERVGAELGLSMAFLLTWVNKWKRFLLGRVCF